MMWSSPSTQLALFWARLSGIGLVFIPSAFLNFVLEFQESFGSTKISHAFDVTLYAGSSVFATTTFTPYFYRAATYVKGGFYVLPGLLSRVFDALFIMIMLISVYILLRELRLTDGAKRNQAKWIFFAAAIAITSGIVNIMPLYGIWLIFPLGHFGIAASILLVAYAILKQRLTRLDIIVKRSAAYSILTAMIAVGYVASTFITQTMFQNLTGYKSLAPVALMALAVALTFEPVQRNVQRYLDTVFFKTHYEYQDAISGFSKMVVKILDLDELLHKTAATIKDTLKLSYVEVFLHDSERREFSIAAFAGKDESFIGETRYGEDNNLAAKLRSNGNRVIMGVDKPVNVYISLFVKNELIGFLVLGEKLSGDVYTPNDIDLLSTLADQLSIAVENARLYRAAVTDKVSRLFSGTYFYDRLEEELARSKEHKTSLGVLMLDIDGFTLINDREGSAVADYIISAIGAEIENEIRPYDIAARVGDDEFAIMLPGVQRDEIHFWESKMQASVARLRINGETGLVTVSAGSAFTENGLKPSRRLLNEAKRDLIQTKSRRNASGLYS